MFLFERRFSGTLVIGSAPGKDFESSKGLTCDVSACFALEISAVRVKRAMSVIVGIGLLDAAFCWSFQVDKVDVLGQLVASSAFCFR